MHFYRQIQIHKWVVSFSFFLTSSLPASPFFLCVTKRGFINWVIGAAGAVQLNMSWIWIIGWTETEKRSDYLAYLFLFSVHACLWWEGSKVFSGCIFLEAHKYIGHWMSVQTASHVSKWHLAPGQIEPALCCQLYDRQLHMLVYCLVLEMWQMIIGSVLINFHEATVTIRKTVITDLAQIIAKVRNELVISFPFSSLLWKQRPALRPLAVSCRL